MDANDCAALKIKLDRINERIIEAEARLGAHSVKPILMQQLFELEEERDTIIGALTCTADGSPVCP